MNQHQKWVDFVFGSYPYYKGFSTAPPTPKNFSTSDKFMHFILMHLSIVLITLTVTD